MIQTLRFPLPQSDSFGFGTRNQYLFLLSIFNILAFVHFGALQIRVLLELSVGIRMHWVFLSIWGSYNIFAICAVLFLKLKSNRALLTHWIAFFLIAALFYNLSNAFIYQLSFGQPVVMGKVLRSFMYNTTGFIHVSMLLTLLVYVIHFWFHSSNQAKVNPGNKLELRTPDGIQYVNPQEIIFAKAEQNYVTLQLLNKKELFRYKISDLEHRLTDYRGFIRSHRSYILNSRYVSKLVSASNGVDVKCQLDPGFTVPVSRAKKAEVIRFLRDKHNHS